MQSEVRALLHDYLSEGDDAVVSARSQIMSVNDILRNGRYVRDNTRVRKQLGNIGLTPAVCVQIHRF